MHLTRIEIETPTGSGAVAVAMGLEEDVLDQLCEASVADMVEGHGFNNWDHPPSDKALKAFWKGVTVSPYRDLILATWNDRIVGAAQLIRPGPIAEMGTHAGTLSTFFVAPEGRGHGLARAMLTLSERLAAEAGLLVLELSVRANRTAAVKLIESMGYHLWAEKPDYAYVGGKFYEGLFFSKQIGDPKVSGEGAIE